MFGRKRSTTVEKLTHELSRQAHNDPLPWQHLFLSLSASDASNSGSAFFFNTDGSWRWADVVEPGDGLLELFRALREEARAEPRGAWDCCLFRLTHGSSEPEITFLYGPEAEAWRVTPSTFAAIVERARPT